MAHPPLLTWPARRPCELWRISRAGTWSGVQVPPGAPRPDASKALRLMAGLLARGSQPLAPSRLSQWLKRGLAAYSCGGSSGFGIAPGTGFPFHLPNAGGPSRASVSAVPLGVNGCRCSQPLTSLGTFGTSDGAILLEIYGCHQ